MWLSCVLLGFVLVLRFNTVYDCSSRSLAVPWISSESCCRVVASVLRLVNWSLFLYSAAMDLMSVLRNVWVRFFGSWVGEALEVFFRTGWAYWEESHVSWVVLVWVCVWCCDCFSAVDYFDVDFCA